jgi:hypothetical protein
MRLSEKHGTPRLEAACRRALHFDDLGYGTVKRILERGLEREPLPEETPVLPAKQTYLFARPGSEIFN